MRRRDIEKMIKDSAEAQRPSLRDSIIESCKSEPQIAAEVKDTARGGVSFSERLSGFLSGAMAKRIAALAVCLVLIVTGTVIGLTSYFGQAPTGDSTDGGAAGGVTGGAITTVYLDINPSLVLELDGENKIIKCTAANKDAEAALEGLSLVGKELDLGLDEIFGAMYEHEYISTESNSVLVSVDGAEELTEGLLSGLAEKINHTLDSRGVECSVIAQRVKVDENMKREAKERGISPGKMHLINKMVDGMDGYTEADKDELAGMSIKELDLIYSSKGDDEHFKDDVTSGTPGGFVTDHKTIEDLIRSLGKSDITVDWSRAKISWEKTAGGRKMIYSIPVVDNKTGESLVYKIDCMSGNIIESVPAGEQGGGRR